ncbi:MAG TPA: nuclear transport factor 2 family protein [Actinomycetota bacterium]
MAHVIETILRSAYDAFATEDADRLFELFTEDVCFHVPGQGPLAGTYQGRSELTDLFQRIHELTDGTFRLEVQHVLADYEFAVALVLALGERQGESYEGQDVHVWRIVRGKFAELWIHPGDQYAADAFLSSVPTPPQGSLVR